MRLFPSIKGRRKGWAIVSPQYQSQLPNRDELYLNELYLNAIHSALHCNTSALHADAGSPQYKSHLPYRNDLYLNALHFMMKYMLIFCLHHTNLIIFPINCMWMYRTESHCIKDAGSPQYQPHLRNCNLSKCNALELLCTAVWCIACWSYVAAI